MKWECFCDQRYFGMWCVRRREDNAFLDGFHVVSKAEAEHLVELLESIPDDEPRYTLTDLGRKHLEGGK
jgi:hypothetical protein